MIRFHNYENAQFMPRFITPPSALYETFEPAKARSILDRLELHFTPKHGSWLNMAEIELNVLSRQCLKGYIPQREFLASETLARETERNTNRATVDWRFTTADARIKLKKLYPVIHRDENVKRKLTHQSMIYNLLDPPPLGGCDLADAKKRIGDHMFINGNMNSVNFLLNATPDTLDGYVKQQIADGAPGGGYILSSACSVAPAVNPELLEALAPLEKNTGNIVDVVGSDKRTYKFENKKISFRRQV
jgi:hypothetical protein